MMMTSRSNYMKKGLRIAAPILITLVALAIFVPTAIAAMNTGSVPDDTKTITYAVQPGDTVWGIASHFDKRDAIEAAEEWIYERNHLSKSVPLQIGQVLEVPVGR